MTRKPTLEVVITGDSSGAERALSDTETRLGKFQSNVDKAVVPSAAVLAGIGAIGLTTIDSASKAEQALGGTRAVFGKYADTVNQAARSADQALGVSEGSYNELATTIGGSLKNAGYAQDELGGKTNDLIGRAADLSSVFGGDAASAAGAMGAALRGEYDSLEQYGVFLNAAAVEAELARTGQDNLTGAALDAAKKQATYNLIMEQSADYAGNFAAEVDTAANAEQRATAAREDAAAQLGGSLLPAWTALQNTLAAVMVFVAQNSQAFVVLGAVLAGLAATVLAVSAVTRAYTAVMALWKAATAAATVAQRVFNAAMRANPIGLIITAITVLIGLLVLAYNKVGWFRSGVDAAVSWIRRAWDGLTRALGAAWNATMSAVGAAITRLKSAWSSATSAVRSAWSSTVAGVKSAWSSATSAVQSGVNRIRSAWSSATSAVRSAWSSAMASVRSVISAVSSAWSSAVSGIRSAWTSAMSAVSSAVQLIRAVIMGVFTRVASQVSSVTSTIASAFSTAFNTARGVVNGVISVIRTLIGYIQSALDKIGPLKSVGGFLGGLFSSGYQNPAVASTVPDDGSPFYLHAAGFSGLVPSYGVAPSSPARAAGPVVQVTVNGALDPNATARQIRNVLTKDGFRDGEVALWS